MNFSTNSSLSLIFITNQGVDVKVDVAMLSGELLRDFFPELVAVGSWSDVDDGGLDVLVDVSHGLFKALIGVHKHTVGVRLKERDQCRSLFVIFLDLLREYG